MLAGQAYETLNTHDVVALYLQANAKQFFDQYLQLTIPHTTRGLAYAYHWGAARPAMDTAFLAIAHSKNLRAQGGDASYAAQLLNYATYQVRALWLV